MSDCKKCGRPLMENEHKLCPSCKSERAARWRRALEIGAGVIAVTATILSICTGRGGGGGKGGRA